uniref:Uncharacterized protein n=1 Tax=Rhizophora mucronata TaxID=61149 RepID=A0A2P2NQ88_RHIMU
MKIYLKNLVFGAALLAVGYDLSEKESPVDNTILWTIKQ